MSLERRYDRQATYEAIRRQEDHLPVGPDLLLIVLKGHLLIEEQLDALVRAAVSHPECLPKRLSFRWLLTFAKAVALDIPNPRTWAAVEKIDEFRNGFAHRIELQSTEEKLHAWIDEVGAEYVRDGWISLDAMTWSRSDRLRGMVTNAYMDLVRVRMPLPR